MLARSLESSSSSTTATPVASSNNGSWEEAGGAASTAMRGGRGQSFFPVRGGRGGGPGTSAQLYTAGSIAPPNFSFRPGVSGEMLL